MILMHAVKEAKTIEDLNRIFTCNSVDIQIYALMDTVRVSGYVGTISTDVIANKISTYSVSSGALNTIESEKLADTIATKVFHPLKDLVKETSWCSCYGWHRVGYTPNPVPEFGNSIALKHAMTLSHLSSRYDSMGGNYND